MAREKIGLTWFGAALALMTYVLAPHPAAAHMVVFPHMPTVITAPLTPPAAPVPLETRVPVAG